MAEMDAVYYRTPEDVRRAFEAVGMVPPPGYELQATGFPNYGAEGVVLCEGTKCRDSRLPGARCLPDGSWLDPREIPCRCDLCVMRRATHPDSIGLVVEAAGEGRADSRLEKAASESLWRVGLSPGRIPKVRPPDMDFITIDDTGDDARYLSPPDGGVDLSGSLPGGLADRLMALVENSLTALDAPRPRGFYDLLLEMMEIHDRKASDYAPGEDRFKNFRQCEAMGIPAFEGCVVRMGDKFSRIMNLIKKGKAGEGAAVADESIVDTLMDTAIYALIAIQLYEERDEPPH